MPLNDVLKEFIFELEIKKYSKRTIKGYRNNNALFFTFTPLYKKLSGWINTEKGLDGIFNNRINFAVFEIICESLQN